MTVIWWFAVGVVVASVVFYWAALAPGATKAPAWVDTWGEVTNKALLDRAYAAYLADEIDLGEFEWWVEDALSGRVSTPAANAVLNALSAARPSPTVRRPPRTLQDAIREGKAVGPREHIPQVLAEADMDRKIASAMSRAATTRLK